MLFDCDIRCLFWYIHVHLKQVVINTEVIDVRNNHFTSVVSGSVHSDDTVYETRISVKRVSKHMHELMLVSNKLNMNVE